MRVGVVTVAPRGVKDEMMLKVGVLVVMVHHWEGGNQRKGKERMIRGDSREVGTK